MRVKKEKQTAECSVGSLSIISYDASTPQIGLINRSVYIYIYKRTLCDVYNCLNMMLILFIMNGRLLLKDAFVWL